MAPKRRRADSANEGLPTGAILDRRNLVNVSSSWGWVDTQVKSVTDITLEHRLRTCELSASSNHAFCANKYASKNETIPKIHKDTNEDIIVISDTDEPACSKKLCKANPNCLNYLGQNIWEGDAEDAWEAYCKAIKLGGEPSLTLRPENVPVGLRNLGATCYANAYLQVWFQNFMFREGVYSCQPAADSSNAFRDSPLYHLQVTFAALEDSKRNVYNPESLIQSLQLQTTEQQDAQEFAKLFITHLDTEFGKQPTEALKNLVANQFQGKQAYGTVCSCCGFVSQVETEFYEIEVNLVENAKLEDCIATALRKETLSGDNQYRCSQCADLRDATRFIELRSLPPVLHISLMRFVYDLNTMERKKSKHFITFPALLDMCPYLNGAQNLHYELRGVLLHKGPSAHHGHYEAQIFDIKTQAWYQFNDEVVTKISHLGDKRSSGTKDIVIVDDEDDNKDQSCSRPAKKKRKLPQRKKKANVIDDDDDPDITIPGLQQEIISKDAYMLIYARRDSDSCRPSDSSKKTAAPVWAQEAVAALNQVYDTECEGYENRISRAKKRFEVLARQVRDIYQTWNASSVQEDSVILSKQSLREWLSIDAIESYASGFAENDDSELTAEDIAGKKVLSQDDIICEHGFLDIQKAVHMKRLRKSSYEDIATKTGCFAEPLLTPEDVCVSCTATEFRERLYRIEHPRYVQRFEQADEPVDGGFWISARWLKDWKLMKPKMRFPSNPDIPPDAEPFVDDVLCEHGKLCLGVATRRKISAEAYTILRELFPHWQPTPAGDEPCALCESLDVANQDTRQKLKDQAQIEKSALKTLPDAAKGKIALLEDVPCSLVPATFLKEWREFIFRPSHCKRPSAVDTFSFFCEHQLLNFNPNIKADMSALAVIGRNDWDQLQNLYTCGPPIHVERKSAYDNQFLHDIKVCKECREKKNSDFETTTITVRVLNESDSVSTHAMENRSPVKIESSKTRKSSRLRENKNRVVQKQFSVSKSTSVKEIKIMLQDELDVPTICQRLFYRGVELEEGFATVASLSILSNDMLEMKEIEEKDDFGSDDEVVISKGNRREQETGFSGTLLGGPPSRSGTSTPSSTRSTPIEDVEMDKSCSACTYANIASALHCEVCETAF